MLIYSFLFLDMILMALPHTRNRCECVIGVVHDIEAVSSHIWDMLMKDKISIMLSY